MSRIHNNDLDGQQNNDNKTKKMKKPTINITEEDNEEFDTKLDILKFTANVKSRIKEDITSDFILAKLTEKDKEGITEMTCNAYFAKRIILTALKHTKTQTEIKIIKHLANATFDAYMTRIYMVANLNRNVPKNHLLRILAEKEEEPETPETEQITQKIKDLTKQKPE